MFCLLSKAIGIFNSLVKVHGEETKVKKHMPRFMSGPEFQSERILTIISYDSKSYLNIGFLLLSIIHVVSEINELSRSAFTCSKLTTETLEQGVKYVQS